MGLQSQLALKPAWPPPLATLAAVLTITHASAVMPTLPSPARPLLVLSPPALLPLLPPPWPHPWLHPCQVLPALLPALSPRLPPQLHPHQSRPPTLLPRRRLVASWPVLLSLLPSLCKR